jgi:3',5'-cyclic AMP phosphodiesterase CpdA
VPGPILHVSDLHAGPHEEPAVEAALAALSARLNPVLVVASGDLTHRGKPEQHARAAALLKGLGRPVLAIPGNHDIPLLPPARMTRTFAAFTAEWETTEPVVRLPGLVAIGLDSVRPWRHQSGGLSEKKLDRAETILLEAPEDAFRVVALHHHLTRAPWRPRKLPVARRDEVLTRLAAAGAELIVSGHTHQAAVGARTEFEVLEAGDRGVVLSVAPGLGRPRPHRRGEARGLHVYQADDRQLHVSTYTWREGDFVATANRSFSRS